MKYVNDNILDGIKVPHIISKPVIHKEGNIYSLAVFVTFYTRADYSNRVLNRPTVWALIDFENGDVVEKRSCNELEFSDASYSKKYDIKSDGCMPFRSEKYYAEAFAILDAVRRELLDRDVLDEEKYRSYLDMILEDTPEGYRRFYNELSLKV